MNHLTDELKAPFDNDKDYRAAYVESFMNSWVAAQIKVLREQRKLSQQELAEMVGTKQAGISRLENVNYSSWKVDTLMRLARAFDVRLRISFEEFGTFPDDVLGFSRARLERDPYTEDRVFNPKEEAAARMEYPAPAEINALGNTNNNVLPFVARRNQNTELSGGDKNASSLDSTGASTGFHRTSGTESGRKGLSSGYGAGDNETVSLREIAFQA